MIDGSTYLLLGGAEGVGGGRMVTPYNGLCGETQSERDTFAWRMKGQGLPCQISFTYIHCLKVAIKTPEGGLLPLQITHPAHEGWPHHQGLHSLLFSNSDVGSFTSHKNQISESAVRWDQQFFVLIREDQKVYYQLQLSLQRQHFLLSYLKTRNVGPPGV